MKSNNLTMEDRLKKLYASLGLNAVSYTHLTLPTT